MKMDGRRLAFADGTFDIAYSLSSIEHFGGLDGATATVREMGRVLKPGGILVLATEYVLSGPAHEETFQPGEVATLIRHPGLELVEPIDEQVYRRYRAVPVDLHRNPYETPHMLVRFGETVFTSVMVFLRKQG
jgi:SAM-dependent methyltransferase